MKVFKFGGASVKDASAIINVAKIISLYQGQNLVVVVSAMGKVTNMLEQLTKAYYYKKDNAFEILDQLREYHHQIVQELFPDNKHHIYNEINNVFVEIEWAIEEDALREYDYEYDQIVSTGELLSSKIVSAFLNLNGNVNKWLDARDFLQTDNTYREGKVNWDSTQSIWNKDIMPFFNAEPKSANGKIMVTQGFIGATSENFTTTLGREGSDYTAAIVAHISNAENLTIWKDVPGVLNADPKWFDDTEILKHISYHDAIELAYYGASVIHPKTIKPLQNKNIPLLVKSFVNPQSQGTTIDDNPTKLPVASFIFKVNQVLVSISPKDFSFIVEENLSDIFKLFADYRVKINVMQNTALKFSVCIDFDERKTPELIEQLRKNYNITFNDNLELVTIRYYDQKTIERVTINKQVFLELKSRNTVQMVMKNRD